MNLVTLWPWPLTFELQNSITCRVSQVHSLYKVWTLWNHSFLSYAPDKQTNKQTDSNILPKPTDIVVVGNNHVRTVGYLTVWSSVVTCNGISMSRSQRSRPQDIRPINLYANVLYWPTPDQHNFGIATCKRCHVSCRPFGWYVLLLIRSWLEELCGGRGCHGMVVNMQWTASLTDGRLNRLWSRTAPCRAVQSRLTRLAGERLLINDEWRTEQVSLHCYTQTHLCLLARTNNGVESGCVAGRCVSVRRTVSAAAGINRPI